MGSACSKREKQKERRKEGKQVGSNLALETLTPLTTKLPGKALLPLPV